MGFHRHLVGWLILVGFIIQSCGAEDTEHDSNLPKNECLFDDRMKGTAEYFPESLKTDTRVYLCQKAWGDGPNRKPLDPTISDKTQYLTLYDKTHRIPIYSAYIAEPWKENKVKNKWEDKDRKHPNKNNDRSDWQDHISINKKRPLSLMPTFSRSEDYTGWDTLDRGHLFPVQFTADWLQNKATHKITNTIPQDTTFNKSQWGKAETLLKDVAIKRCQIEDGIPFTITGSVPDYYGEFQGRPVTGDPLFKIGCAVPDDPCPREKMLVTVPTHMWTTLMCIAKKGTGHSPPPPETLFHASFIGLNHKSGKIIWYNNFNVFEEELKAMLKVTSLFSKLPILNIQTSKTVFELIEQENKNTKSKGDYQQFHKDDIRIQDFKNKNMYHLRRNDIKQRVEREYQHIGVVISSSITSISSSITKKQKHEIVKRNVDTTEVKSSVFLLELNDEDPNADIGISKIQLTETYANEEENITLDLETKQIIVEGNNKNENKLTASVWNNGEKTELTEVQSTDRVIRIELKPRGE